MDSEEIEGWDKESERAWQNDEHVAEFSELVVKDVLMKYCPPPAKVLDAGCGIGKHISAFTSLGYICEGIDQSAVGMEYARKTNPTCKISLMRIQELKSEDEYELIHTSAVLQHNTHERKKVILAIFRRALKTGGFLLMTENTITYENVNIYGGVYREDLTDGYSFTHQGWLDFMTEQGFEHVITVFPGPYYLYKVVK